MVRPVLLVLVLVLVLLLACPRTAAPCVRYARRSIDSRRL